MITIIGIDNSYKYLNKVKELYNESFPLSERDPFRHLLNNYSKEHDFVAFEESKKFIGFAYLLTFKNITHILYLAIDPSIRNKGYGHKILEFIHAWKENNKIIVDVEKDDLNANNLLEREKRINFYKKCGYELSNISYYWNDVHYELLCHGEMIDLKEFDDFWKHLKTFEDMGEFLYNTFKN